MNATEKKNLLIDCVSKAIDEIYEEKKTPDREVVETVLKSYLTEAGLSGLYDSLVKVFNKTLESSGLVPVEYWETKEESIPVVEEPEEIPATPFIPSL